MLTLIDRETGRPDIHGHAVASSKLAERGHRTWRVVPGVGSVCTHCGRTAHNLVLEIAQSLNPRALIRGVLSVTRIQRVIFNASAWMPRPTPLSVRSCPSASRSRATRRRWCPTSATSSPASSRGRSTASRSSRPMRATWNNHGVERRARLRRDARSRWTRTSRRQSTASTNAKPDVSEVRLILTQPVTTNLEDLHTFIDRRADVCSVLATLNGTIEGGRSGRSAYSHAYSLGYS